MVDQNAMNLLEKQRVSLPIGWDKFVLSHCKSAGVEGFGHGVVQNIRETKKDADEMGVPFTALHVVGILMQTAKLMYENRYPKEQIILAIHLCPRLLPHIIENPLTVNDAADFLINSNADLLFKLEKGQ